MSTTPDASSVKAELARLLASEEFRSAERLAAILRFLVDRAIAGGTPAKEYEIGVEVLRRPPNYDPRTDPIVRVEMRQLRLKLARFYGSDGHSPVRIDVPKGRYEATFSIRPASLVSGVGETPAAVTHRPDAEAPLPEARRRSLHVVPALLSGLAAVLIVSAAFVWMFAGARRPRTAPEEVGPPSVAVLPFANLSGDPAQAYFSDGLAEEIMSTLMRVEGLRVVGRTSAFSFRASSADTGEIARRLGVSAVLSGSVRRERARVRVIARLLDASGVQYWSRTFDVDAAATVAVQERVAAAVADALKVRLDPASGQTFVRRSNDDPAAHDRYLRARALANSRKTADLLASIDLYEQAIGLDRGYALAYAGLADAHGVLAFNGQVPADQAIAKARAAAAHALRLDPTLGEAVAHLASLDAFIDWNWTAAEEGFRRAVALTPSHPRVHAWFGQMLLAQGRFHEAVDQLLTAQRLDPLAASIGYALGEAYLYSFRTDAATTQARRLIAADAKSWGGHNLLARSAIQGGRRAEALSALAHARGELWADALALVASGDAAGARRLLDERSPSVAATQPFALASLYAQAGDGSAAMRYLQRAYDLRQVDLAYLAVDPGFTALHDHPDYQAIVSKVGLKVDLAAGGGG
jgi:TolB-like protein/Tfp pilus assembly protein PilF